MCGFVGWINTRPAEPVDLTILQAMNQKITHRGPDDEGYFVHQQIGLAHKRLSIIDLSARGHQPLFNEDRTIVIVFNGEIYNYLALNKPLIAAGHRFASHTDTETIVHAYEEWGPACVAKLDGMFSFALVDLRQQRLILAKDRFGKKPLYYTLQHGALLFGSELKAFFPHPRFEKSLDLAAVSKYLAYEYVPTPHTILKGCYKLPRASFLVCDLRQLTTLPEPQTYWALRYEPKIAISADEAEEELLRLFREAVRKRLMSDVPLGVFLSGGVDSSSIVAMMADVLPGKQIHTFNIGFSEQSFDESSYAATVAAHFGTDHHEERLSPATMLDLFPAIIEKLDEPFADSSIVPTYLLCQYARKFVTVALGGDGSDELFAGYDPFLALKFVPLAERIPLPIIRLMRTLIEAIPLSRKNMSTRFRIKHFLKGFQPYTKHALELRNNVWMGSFYPEAQAAILAPGLNTDIDYLAIYDQTLKQMRQTFAVNPLDRMVDHYVNFYLHDDILVKVDRASMMNSLEVRAPFLDTELAEFICRLPVSLKMNGFVRKYLLKKAAVRTVPKKIVYRSKKGFGIPLAAWFKGPLREVLFDTFSETHLQQAGIFNAKAVQRFISDFLHKDANIFKEIWTLFIFEMWRKQHGI